MADDDVVKLFAKLNRLKAFDFYTSRSLNAEQQNWLRLICGRYLIAPPLERRAINSYVTPNISFLFFLYAKAMAIESVIDRNDVKVLQGLASLSIENGTFDWRDSLMVLNLLFRSATKIEADAAELFWRVAALSTSGTAERFLQFIARDPEHRGIDKFGWKEGIDAEGRFSYVAK